MMVEKDINESSHKTKPTTSKQPSTLHSHNNMAIHQRTRSSTPPPPKQQEQRRNYKNKHSAMVDDSSSHSSDSSSSSSSDASYVYSYKKRSLPDRHQYVAMDCEMVQGALSGQSLCARVVIVDWKGRTMLDTYCTPTEPVCDYRTFVSGITKEDLVDAPSFASVRRQVADLLRNKILVGHALINDLECLQIDHPWENMRDTALYAPFQKTNRCGHSVPRKLRDLVHEKLGDTSFQNGQHDPKEDAVAALNLYKQHRPRWEACVVSTIQAQKRLERQQKQHYYAALEQQRMQYYWANQQQQQQYVQQPVPAAIY